MSDHVISKSLVQSNAIIRNGARVILALQHLIAMFGATVLVPILTGINPTVAIFTAGVGTLIFHFCTRGKVPVFLGSSFAFIPVILTVKELYGGDLSYAHGGILVAGIIYCMLAGIIYVIGIDKIRRLLPAQVVGPMIIVIGLNLIPTAIGMASANFLLAIITLGVALFIKFKTKGMINQLSILIAVVVGYIAALMLNQVDITGITTAPLLSAPSLSLPKFDMGAIAIISPIVIAVFMEHLGDITTNGQVVGENFIDNPGLHRTLLGDGLATMFAGLVGGPANTTYGENTGVLAITKNYDPSILRLTAVLAIVLSFVGKIGGLLSSIPTPVMGGISIMLFSMIAIVGVQTIQREKVSLNWKNFIIMGTILFIGLGSSYINSNFGINIGIKLNESVSISGLSLAAIMGIILNFVLNRK